jgi:cysteinyl-tRNA synthetase
MTLKFFILQAHYRGTLDFSNAALQASEKGLNRLLTASETLDKIKPSKENNVDVGGLKQKCYDALNEDLNTPILIAHLFEMVTTVNQLATGALSIDEPSLEELKKTYNTFVFEILGLMKESVVQSDKVDGLMQLLIDMRNEAKVQKNYALSDEIRNKLSVLGFEIKDSKDGTSYSIN